MSGVRPAPPVEGSVVAQLQNALVAAMEEVDTLRGQMFAEQAKIQREFRETIDVLINNGKIDPSRAALVQGSEGSASIGRRLEALEAAVRMIQGAAAPVSMDKVLQQTKTFLEQTDREVETIRVNIEEKMRWVDAKMSDISASAHQKDLRLQEQFDRFQAQQTQMIDEVMASIRRRESAIGVATPGPVEVSLPPEVELKMTQLTKLAHHVDKRVSLLEESISQVDAEQRDIVNAMQGLRASVNAEKIRNSQSRAAVSPSEQASEALTVVTIRDEVTRLMHNDVETRHRQLKEDILAVKAEVNRSHGTIDKTAVELARVANQYQGLQQMQQRSDNNVAALQERLEGEMRAHFQRAEQTQKAFFTRQDQLLQNERHEIAVRLSSDLQRMQQKSLEEHQNAESRRMDDIRGAHAQLRDDFNRFVGDQRLEMEKTHAQLRDYVNQLTREQADNLSKQFREVSDDTRRAMIGSLDDVRKLSTRTGEELKRIKQAVDDNTQRLSEQHQYLHNRVQQVMDEEVKRFDRISEESRLRLAQQIDGEVARAVGATEGSLVRAYHTMKEEYDRDVRIIREELEGLRGTLAAVAAPTSTMAAFETRTDAIRKDVTQIHSTVARLCDFENRWSSTLNYELRRAVDSSRVEVMRDVAVQLQRFDRTLNDLAQEQQQQYSMLSESRSHAAAPPLYAYGAATPSHHSYAMGAHHPAGVVSSAGRSVSNTFRIPAPTLRSSSMSSAAVGNDTPRRNISPDRRKVRDTMTGAPAMSADGSNVDVLDGVFD